MNKVLKKFLLLFPPIRKYYLLRIHYEEAINTNIELRNDIKGLQNALDEKTSHWEAAVNRNRVLEAELTEYSEEKNMISKEYETELISLHKGNQALMDELQFLKSQIKILAELPNDTVNEHSRIICSLASSVNVVEQQANMLLRESGKWEFKKKINAFIISLDDKFKIERTDFIEKLIMFKHKSTDITILQKLLLLKILNLILAKYEMANGYTQLSSKPFSLTFDPSNSCVLKCPGCVHNKDTNQDFDWVEPYNMSLETFTGFIDIFGPFATGITGYNYGEPFINPLTPQIIEKARRFMAQIVVSSNLSVEIDAEAIVNSGLDWLVASIDGATAKTYNIYRRNGDFNLVLENLRKICSAKKKLRKNTPIVNWQFLTFKHNIHEVDDVFKLANETGCDFISIATPFPVGDDSIEVAVSEKKGFHRLKSRDTFYENNNLDTLLAYDVIEDAWKSFLEEPIYNEELPPQNANTKPCSWLYQNITIDALGRVMPCCTVPIKGETSLIFDTINANSYNSEKYLQARDYFIRNIAHNTTQCEICNSFMSSVSSHNLEHILSNMNLFGLYKYLDSNVKQILARW